MSLKTLRLAALALASVALVCAAPAGAQTAKYPRDTVMLATHSSPGGGSDLFPKPIDL